MTKRFQLPIPMTACLLALLGTGTAFAAAPVFSEDFDLPANTSTITTANTHFTFTRVAGSAPHTGTLVRQPSSFHTGQSLLLGSSGYGSTPNLTGVGVNRLPASGIWTLSMDITSAVWTSGTSTYIMMGDWNGRDSQQVYNPDGVISIKGVSEKTMEEQSLFALKINGSSALHGGYFSQLSSGPDLPAPLSDMVLVNGLKQNLHIIANGGASTLTIDGTKLSPGTMAIYLDEILVATPPLSVGTSASALRIMSVGNSVGNGQVKIEIDNLRLWNSDISPKNLRTYGSQ